MTERIKETIRKLRARTVARGCSEAEAQTAIEKVAALMRAHGLEEADLEMAEATCRRPAPAGPHARDALAGTVAWCTNTAALKSKAYGEATISYSGLAHQAEIAAYTRDMLEAAIDRALRAFRASSAYKRKRSQRTRAQASHAFVVGMVDSLCRRLLAAFEGQRNEAAARRALDWQQRAHPDITSQSRRPKPAQDARAALLGSAAASGVELAAGVGADQAGGAIGGPRRQLAGPR